MTEKKQLKKKKKGNGERERDALGSEEERLFSEEVLGAATAAIDQTKRTGKREEATGWQSG